MAAMHIGVDVGGTKIAAALYDSAFNLRHHTQVETPRDYAHFLSAMAHLVDELKKQAAPTSSAPILSATILSAPILSATMPTIGVGFPGFVWAETGRVHAGNVPAIKGQPLQRDVEKKLGQKIALQNDAACMAIAEADKGAGRGHAVVFAVILGTGVNGIPVVNGHLLPATNGYQEWGHAPFPVMGDDNILACSCGRLGCIETFLSGAALARLAENMTGQKISPEELAEGHHPQAEEILEQYSSRLARALVGVVMMLDPAIILFSGGLSQLPGLVQKTECALRAEVFGQTMATRLAVAQFGPQAGLLGAALVGRQASGYRAGHEA